MINGHFDAVWIFNDAPLDRRRSRTSFGGFSLDAFATRALSRHFGIKGGLTYDFNVETNNLQPLVLGAFRF
jgi:hypothetical protein